jgi:hypothetical protein
MYVFMYVCMVVCVYVFLCKYTVCRVVVSIHLQFTDASIYMHELSLLRIAMNLVLISEKVCFRAVLRPFWWLKFLILNTVPSFLWSIWLNSLYSANLAQPQLSIDEMLDDISYSTFKTEKSQIHKNKKLSVTRKWRKFMAFTQRLIHTPRRWLCKRDAINRTMT